MAETLSILGQVTLTTCNRTALPFTDSETQWKFDLNFENTSSPTSRLPYIDIIQQVLIHYILSAKHHFEGY